MTPTPKTIVCLFFLAHMVLRAQTPASPDDPMARQRAAAEAMQKSLEQQKLSVQRQLQQERPASGSFFQLPRPATLGVTVAAPAAAPAAPPPACDPLPAEQVDVLVDSAASRESLDGDLIRGVIRQESAFRPCAVSPKGAEGLMQLMPDTALQFGVMNPFDPIQNVNAGAKFLKQLLTRYGGDLGKTLGAYNAGPERVDAVDGIPQIPETQEYIKQILSTLPIKR
jgi:soluble lytic murein transglycosylase-like protein